MHVPLRQVWLLPCLRCPRHLPMVMDITGEWRRWIPVVRFVLWKGVQRQDAMSMTDMITADITTAADTVMVLVRPYAAQVPSAEEGMDAINPAVAGLYMMQACYRQANNSYTTASINILSPRIIRFSPIFLFLLKL